MSYGGVEQMELRTIFGTLALIFLAELGDKTQLTTMLLAAQSHSPWSVFIGAALALTLTSLLGMLAGQALMAVVPVRIIKMVAGGAFVLLGGLLLTGRW